MSQWYYLDNIAVTVPFRPNGRGSRIQRRFNHDQCDMFELDERTEIVHGLSYPVILTTDEMRQLFSSDFKLPPEKEPIPVAYKYNTKRVLYKTDEGIWVKALFFGINDHPYVECPFAERIHPFEATEEIIAYGHNLPDELLCEVNKDRLLLILKREFLASGIFAQFAATGESYSNLDFIKQSQCRKMFHIYSFIKALTNGDEPTFEFPTALIDSEYHQDKELDVFIHPFRFSSPGESFPIPEPLNSIDLSSPIGRDEPPIDPSIAAQAGTPRSGSTSPRSTCRDQFRELTKSLRLGGKAKAALLSEVFIDLDQITIEDAMVKVFGANYKQSEDALRKHYRVVNEALDNQGIACILSWRAGYIHKTDAEAKAII